MKTVQIKGEARENVGKKDAAQVRKNGGVPCVLYGGEAPVHFSAPVAAFNTLLFTPDAYLVNIDVAGKAYVAILKDSQFNPVTDVLSHADFLLAPEGKLVEIEIPVVTEGVPPGVLNGGKLQVILRKLKVRGAAADLPESISIDVSGVDLGGSVQVKAIKEIKGVEILSAAKAVVARVQVTRTARLAASDEAAPEAATEAAN